eukprot:Amastigsp_a511954_17.p2 type:complete len:104 gc:universal Amastigsp_a511954_17:335-24(-)
MVLDRELEGLLSFGLLDEVLSHDASLVDHFDGIDALALAVACKENLPKASMRNRPDELERLHADVGRLRELGRKHSVLFRGARGGAAGTGGIVAHGTASEART